MEWGPSVDLLRTRKELCSFIVSNFRRRKVRGTKRLGVNHFSQSTVILFL